MRIYTIHERPDPAADRVDRAEGLVFVKDGFSWAAALFAPIWLIVHRLWWPLLGYVVVGGAFQLVQLTLAFDKRWLGLAVLALHLLIGLEADTLRRWSLERRGWRTSARSAARRRRNASAASSTPGCPPSQILAATTQSRPSGGGGWWRVGNLLGARSK
jgi:hypothetical protein